MAVNIFEWEVEDAYSDPVHVKAGHLTIKIENLSNDYWVPRFGVSIKWGYKNKYYEMEESLDDALEVVRYIAIGLNAEIEAQGAALPNSAEVETIKQSDYIKGFKQYVLILVSLVVVSAWAVGFLMNLAK